MKTTYSLPQYRQPFVGYRRPSAGSVGRLLTDLDDGMAHLADWLLIWTQRARDRRALQTLDAHLLQDIGLSRADVERESAKYFWQR